MTPLPAACCLAALAAALAACAPWRSNIELTPDIAAAPILEVSGWQSAPRPSSVRRIAFGPWTAERGAARRGEDWILTLRRDSAVTGSAACHSVLGGDPRQKGRWQEVPQEVFTCELILAAGPDTLGLEVKSDAGRPFTGQAQSTDWDITVRGIDRLRTRSCLILSTCGWYFSLDGMDIAAVEADARAWVYLSPDLGSEGRDLAALIAAALLLREGPDRPRFGQPQPPMRIEPAAGAPLTPQGTRAAS